ncbi:MAG: glutamate--cysteine ligase [Propioniciclava sp.]
MTFTREQRQRYREKVQLCLDAFEQMLVEDRFLHADMIGMEIELNLVDADYGPRMDNADVLAVIADPDFQTELARFNIEFNVPPGRLEADSLAALEANLRNTLNEAEQRCSQRGAHIMMIGILPTVLLEAFSGTWMSANTRYEALNDAVLAARGEDILLDIAGATGERLYAYADSLAPESVCTSMQLHVQTSPQTFAEQWNAAQILAGPQLAVGANSPFVFGHRLWAESRIPVFTQAADTRPIEYAAQGVRPRVFFGERWITSIFDLFEENSRFFPALLPELSDEDPQEIMAAGGIPQLAEMRLHNGTIYRWNRPVYDTADGVAHLRLENRVLPAGPTVLDTLANAAFYYGALHALARQERPVWTRLAFVSARENFLAGATDGIDAMLFWPGLGEIPASELVLRQLLPLADEGLAKLGVAADLRDRYLGVIEQRCLTGINGAAWQTRCVAALEARGASRREALRAMTAAYAEGMHGNEPVHRWPLPA